METGIQLHIPSVYLRFRSSGKAAIGIQRISLLPIQILAVVVNW